MERVVKYSMEDIRNHNNQSSTWIIIENKVYDVTKFLEEHPGGENVILDEAGKDATVAFNEVGHSSEAKEMLKKYEIGELIDSERVIRSASAESTSGFQCPKMFGAGMIAAHLFIAAVAVGTLIFYRMYRK